jgi:hypothetical protein
LEIVTQAVPFVPGRPAYFPAEVRRAKHILDIIALVTGCDKIFRIGCPAMGKRDSVFDGGPIGPIKNVVFERTPVLVIRNNVRKQRGQSAKNRDADRSPPAVLIPADEMVSFKSCQHR